MPWAKGQSGNPKGRRPNGDTAKDWFSKLGGPQGREYAQQLHRLACDPHPDPHVRIKALAIIAPYVWGKPKEQLEHSGEVSVPVRVVFEYHQAAS